MSLNRWMYRGGRPNGLAKFLNGISAFIHSRGVAPSYLVTLEVLGRSSGKPVSFPLVMTVMGGERYLVSMLGDANWVRNAKADGNRATLRHGATEHVLLEDVPVEQRAPIIKAFLAHAPGARPHMQVDKDAPLATFEAVAPQYPVFRVVSAAKT